MGLPIVLAGVVGVVGVSTVAIIARHEQLERERRRRARSLVDSYGVFVVTGAAGGLGRHLTRVLLEKGKTVAAVDIYEAGLRTLADTDWKGHGDRLLLRTVDIRRLREWEGLFNELEATVGHVDVLINLAGYVRSGAAVGMDEVEVHRHMDINVKGVVFGSQVAARHMLKGGSGHIVNFSSLAGIMSVPDYALYSASKHAVRAFSRALALELRHTGVAVTVVCPDRIWIPDEAAASKPADSLVIVQPRYLRLTALESALFDVILPSRPRELDLPWHGLWNFYPTSWLTVH